MAACSFSMHHPQERDETDPPIPAETIALPTRGFTIDRRKAAIAAAIMWAGFVFMVWAVTDNRTSAFDNWGLMLDRNGETLAFSGSDLFAEMIRDVTGLGGVLLRNLFALGAMVALLFLRLRREAVLFAGTVVLGWIVNSAIKHIVGRPRPEIVPHLTEAGGASFPSGHSFNSAVVYIAMALAFASMSAREPVRYTIVGTALVASAAIAWSRVLLGVHFPSDVAAGWLGGAGWAFLAAAILYKPAKIAVEQGVVDPIDPSGRAK